MNYSKEIDKKCVRRPTNEKDGSIGTYPEVENTQL